MNFLKRRDEDQGDSSWRSEKQDGELMLVGWGLPSWRTGLVASSWASVVVCDQNRAC